MVQEYPGT